MKILRILGTILLGFSLVIGLFIYTTHALELGAANKSNRPYHYHVIKQSKNPSLALSEPEFMEVTIQNNGRLEWPLDKLFLNSIFFDGTLNYAHPFTASTWINGTKIGPIVPANTENKNEVRPGDQIKFRIPIRTTFKGGIYKAYFKPILEFRDTNILTLEGEIIEWMIIVGTELHYQNMGADKQILISLDDQKLLAIENYVVIMETPVSTGKKGYYTPKGWYKILNHIDTAYSSSYRLFMDNWMALSSLRYGFRGYGLHKLPYWKVSPARYAGKEGHIMDGRLYTQGRLYEDYKHLGEKMSHGCVRLGLEAAQVLYDWAENGTLVKVV